LSLALISLALGVGLSAAVYIALTAKGGWFENRASIEFSPADIVLVRGKMTQRGPLAVPIADADGVLVFRLSEKLIDTSSYPTLRIAALGRYAADRCKTLVAAFRRQRPHIDDVD
jgi:hypothetical protein